MFFFAESGSDRVGQCTNRIVKDEQVSLLIFVESRNETLQDGLHVRLQDGTGFLFQGSKSTASSFLYSLVRIQDHSQELYPDRANQSQLESMQTSISPHPFEDRNKVGIPTVPSLDLLNDPAGITTDRPAGD
jgi:hypothetical protein